MEKRLEIDIQVIVHATENPQKIIDAFKEIFDVDADDFTMQTLQGHFDNPITLFHAKLKKKKAQKFAKILTSAIPKSEMSLVIDDLENRCDESSLFLRISKQGLAQKRISLSDEDPIKLKIFTPIYSQRDVIKTYSEILNGTI